MKATRVGCDEGFVGRAMAPHTTMYADAASCCGAYEVQTSALVDLWPERRVSDR